jgi:hypothetical protein
LSFFHMIVMKNLVVQFHAKRFNKYIGRFQKLWKPKDGKLVFPSYRSIQRKLKARSNCYERLIINQIKKKKVYSNPEDHSKTGKIRYWLLGIFSSKSWSFSYNSETKSDECCHCPRKYEVHYFTLDLEKKFFEDMFKLWLWLQCLFKKKKVEGMLFKKSYYFPLNLNITINVNSSFCSPKIFW